MPQSFTWSELGARLAQRRWLVAAPAAGLLALGLGAAAMARLPAGATTPPGGEALRIEVVQPPAPEIAEGPRMGVGELVDGYQHVAAARRAPESEDLLAWLDPLPPLPSPPEPPRPQPPRYGEVAIVTPASPQPSRREPVDRFGFDAPQPDYAAARAARRERLDRIERERRRYEARREPPWRRVQPSVDSGWRPVAELPRESVFY